MADVTFPNSLSTSKCIYLPESRGCYCVKITSIVLGILLSGAVIATYFLGVNAIAVYTTAAAAAFCFLLAISLCVSRCQRIQEPKKVKESAPQPARTWSQRSNTSQKGREAVLLSSSQPAKIKELPLQKQFLNICRETDSQKRLQALRTLFSLRNEKEKMEILTLAISEHVPILFEFVKQADLAICEFLFLECLSDRQNKKRLVCLTNANDENVFHILAGIRLYGQGFNRFLESLYNICSDAMDATNKQGQTPLHLASIEGNTKVIWFLFAHNPSLLSLQDKNGSLPIHYFLDRGMDKEMSRINLLEDKKKEKKELALSSLVTCFIEQTKDLNVKDLNGNTPLHLSAEKKQLQVLTSLIEHGSNPNLENSQSQTFDSFLDNESVSLVNSALLPFTYKITDEDFTEIEEILNDKGDALSQFMIEKNSGVLNQLDRLAMLLYQYQTEEKTNVIIYLFYKLKNRPKLLADLFKIDEIGTTFYKALREETSAQFLENIRFLFSQNIYCFAGLTQQEIASTKHFALNSKK